MTIFVDYIKASLLAEISNSDIPSSLNNLVIFSKIGKKIIQFLCSVLRRFNVKQRELGHRAENTQQGIELYKKSKQLEF